MNDLDTIATLNLGIQEITSLRTEIASLAPKAHAYDTVTAILGLLPKPMQCEGEDIVWRLAQKVSELRAELDAAEPA